MNCNILFEHHITLLTFIRIIFLTSTPGGCCSEHINLISRVFPHPVSPIIITGILHLKKKIMYDSVFLNTKKTNYEKNLAKPEHAKIWSDVRRVQAFVILLEFTYTARLHLMIFNMKTCLQNVLPYIFINFLQLWFGLLRKMPWTFLVCALVKKNCCLTILFFIHWFVHKWGCYFFSFE